MNRTWRDRATGLALLSLASLAGGEAEAAYVAAGNAPREPQPPAGPITAGPRIVADPVLSTLDEIGRPTGAPRLAAVDPAPDIRMSGGDGVSEAIFPGGAASAAGGQRPFDGVQHARDPLQLLPYEPSAALRIPAPAAGGLLLGGWLALVLLRRRARRG